MTQSPLDVLNPMGPAAQQISPLLWGLLWVSVVVAALIAGAVVGGVIARRSHGRDPAEAGVIGSPGGVKWVYIATGVSTAILIGFTGWTLVTMAQSAPRTPPTLTIDVSARQWWWSFGYEPAGSAAGFVTANEIHIPVGRPVRFLLTSPDVIHSFWVPALGGKTDVIPGRTNETWLEADKPGIYRGQCAEYCGEEHAEMALPVVAEPEVDFEAWRAQQAAPASAIGAEVFVARCGECHTVRGTPAAGTKGPDLTHLMSRSTIAAGMLANTIGNLGGWVANPQGLKPGAKMPNVNLSGPDLQAVLTYLETLS
jgi:cytochrome c oxidase subunit 2